MENFWLDQIEDDEDLEFDMDLDEDDFDIDDDDDDEDDDMGFTFEDEIFEDPADEQLGRDDYPDNDL